ncbi:hypothetical protein RR48_13825 [Papilio machaon]|uniref:Uncharacterized protein n=1 Tax=Papilio machaon TaxID=76193 RepID=A0A194RHQ4_PAPMA|nr:hypothetical protein RR48_13825 [Papilio machaon]
MQLVRSYGETSEAKTRNMLDVYITLRHVTSQYAALDRTLIQTVIFIAQALMWLNNSNGNRAHNLMFNVVLKCGVEKERCEAASLAPRTPPTTTCVVQRSLYLSGKQVISLLCPNQTETT